jgi:hypothetical protein
MNPGHILSVAGIVPIHVRVAAYLGTADVSENVPNEIDKEEAWIS